MWWELCLFQGSKEGRKKAGYQKELEDVREPQLRGMVYKGYARFCFCYSRECFCISRSLGKCL